MFATNDARARGSEGANVSKDIGRRQRTSNAFLEERSFRSDSVDEILTGNVESRRRQSVQGGAQRRQFRHEIRLEEQNG